MLSLPQRLLVVAAHPDDEVLGCGGLMVRVARLGGRCRVLILSEGTTTQYPDAPELVARKRHEAREAARILGAESTSIADLPDMALSTVPMARVTAPVEEAIGAFWPDCVVTHHAEDLNSDHRVAHEAVRVATRPQEVYAPVVLAMEVSSSTEYAYRPLRASVTVALSDDDLACKQKALEAYASETRPYPHGRSAAALEATAAYRGFGSRFGRGEAFEFIVGRIPT